MVLVKLDLNFELDLRNGWRGPGDRNGSDWGGPQGGGGDMGGPQGSGGGGGVPEGSDGGGGGGARYPHHYEGGGVPQYPNGGDEEVLLNMNYPNNFLEIVEEIAGRILGLRLQKIGGNTLMRKAALKCTKKKLKKNPEKALRICKSTLMKKKKNRQMIRYVN